MKQCSLWFFLSLLFNSTAQILNNIEISSDNRKARKYFEGSVKFQNTLVQILDLITTRVRLLAEDDIYNASASQVYGILLLTFVMILSPILIILARNGITSIQASIYQLTIKQFKLTSYCKGLVSIWNCGWWVLMESQIVFPVVT